MTTASCYYSHVLISFMVLITKLWLRQALPKEGKANFLGTLIHYVLISKHSDWLEKNFQPIRVLKERAKHKSTRNILLIGLGPDIIVLMCDFCTLRFVFHSLCKCAKVPNGSGPKDWTQISKGTDHIHSKDWDLQLHVMGTWDKKVQSLKNKKRFFNQTIDSFSL